MSNLNKFIFTENEEFDIPYSKYLYCVLPSLIKKLVYASY